MAVLVLVMTIAQTCLALGSVTIGALFPWGRVERFAVCAGGFEVVLIGRLLGRKESHHSQILRPSK